MLDTNVLMSAIFFGGPPAQVLDAWVTGQVELVLSPEILAEYRTVAQELGRKYPERATAVAPILALLTVNATVVRAPPLAEGVCTDPEDDKFLAAAQAVGGALVITGDRALLAVSGWAGIEVLKPRVFVDQYLLGADS